ncbi:cytochrome b [Legionella israelensis]|uniref:Cytochrome b n=1 Tax=Legionella israelensis TaxID=454 RepID=A0AAX1EG62_9GAMM|nr:cytochrome b [Legionella israelensis]QBR84068.1 cytochrome b [Legionella israelensis]
MSKNKNLTYSPMSKLFHWLIAFIVIMMLSFSFFLDSVPEKYRSFAFMIHKSFGITVLFLMLFRFVWVHISGKPPLPDNIPDWQRFMSRFVQYSLYLLLILMPLSGWIMSVAANKPPSYFGLFILPFPGIGSDKALAKWMNQTHEILAWVIITFVALHVIAALKHHFIDKNNVLRRMLPGNTRRMR